MPLTREKAIWYLRTTKVLATDLDDSAVVLIDPLLVWYNARYGAEYTLTDYLGKRLEDLWQISHYEAMKRCMEFHGANRLPPAPYAVKTLHAISLDKPVVAMTHRHDELAESTKEEAALFRPLEFQEIIHCCSSNEEGGFTFFEKGLECLKRGCTAIVEDNLNVAKECSDKGIASFIITTYANSHVPDNELPDLSYRLHDRWRELLELYRAGS
ncbi:MAG: hypothetical protein K0S20_261 [Patescibacteria group bacterium]|jgi:hypothetical protein|nr:hypothetical protein [Patescibacteria group bacterium]